MDYRGLIWVAGDDPSTAIEATVAIDGELSIASKSDDLGSWPVGKVVVERQGDSDFMLTVESDRVMFRPDSAQGFESFSRAAARGISDRIRSVATESARLPPVPDQAPDSHTPPGQKKPKSKLARNVLIAVGVLVAIAYIGSRGTSSNVQETFTKVGDSLGANTAATARVTTTTEPDLPTISSGVYIVPNEVAPGTYRFFGYMARLDANQEIIDNDLVDGDNGLGIMIVASTDAYSEVNGEAILVEDTGPVDPIALGFTEGTYLVGYDIQPGRYRISPAATSDSTYWSRLDRTMDIIDNNLSDGQLIVTVNSSDWALQYTGEISELP